MFVFDLLFNFMRLLFSSPKAVPGPGKYEISSQFDKTPQAYNTEGLEVEHPPFMSQAKVSEREIERVSLF